MTQAQDLDEAVRRIVYDACLTTGAPPSACGIAAELDVPEPDARATLARLEAQHVLVLQPSGEVLMAMPFSAVPTPFLVRTPAFTAFGNCGWDALGIAAMTATPATILASCADCGDALELRVDEGRVSGPPALLHFSLPVRQWWNAVVFT